MRAGKPNQPIASRALDALVTFLLSIAGVLAVFLALVPLLTACASQPPAAPQPAAVESAPPEPEEEASPYIVQGADLAAVVAAVEEVGATVTHELKIIRAVGARLTAAQRAALAEHADVTRIYEDRKVGIDGGS